MKYTLALDIGISSCGWAVVNCENEQIVEAGSNLFEAAEASANQERRSFRQLRRLHRRQRTRIDDFEKLCTNYDLKKPIEKCNTQLWLRNQGLSKKLTQDELFFVLQNMLKHRGIAYLDEAEDDSKSNASEYAKGIQKNQEELKRKYPCEIQLERLNKYGKYRGQTEVSDGETKISLSNVFTVKSYVKEIKKILETQKQYHSFLDDDFIEQYLEIFKRKREYYVGPGNELSRTDYGRFTTKLDENGNYINEDNIFEKLIGTCSIYNGKNGREKKQRAAGASYTAQLFNVLNDLTNIKVDGEKLNEEEKRQIVEIIKNSNSVSMPKIIKRVTGKEFQDVTGYRVDKKMKPIFHTMEVYRKLKKSLEEKGHNIEDYSEDQLDEIGRLLTLNTERDSIKEFVLKNALLPHSEEFIEFLVEFRRKNSSLFSKWQSFCLDIMKELIPELYSGTEEQMTLLTKNGYMKTDIEKYKDCKYVPVQEMLEEIYNPVVRRSVHITVDIINAVIKKYGMPEQVVIEMPRDKNSDDQKNRIKEFQKKREKELDNIIKKLKEEYGIKKEKGTIIAKKKLPLKLKLWNEQGGVCIYSGKPINPNDLLENPDRFEVDHVIPKSISFDDSRNNKVLVYASENQNKGNRTPYFYLRNLDREANFENFKARVIDIYKDNNNKKRNLLFLEDITKIEVLKGFINRNINDTRYASKIVLNTLQTFFKAKGTETKVKVVRGSFTHDMHKKLVIDKDRDESFSHHAVDAMLIAYSQMGYNAYMHYFDDMLDFETGEIIDQEKFNKFTEKTTDKDVDALMYANKIHRWKENIEEAEKKVKYWHRVDKKVNRALCNQTIRGSREIDGKKYKINKLNLFEKDGLDKFNKLIESGKEDSLLVKRNDIKTFDVLMKIRKQYSDADNPFVQYEKETGDYVRKYSKKHNGPRITTLKYLDGTVGSCIDISHKYGHEKGSKKVFLESLKPYRSDVYYSSEQGYTIVGLKYSDIKCEKGKYSLNMEAYNELLIKNGILQEGDSFIDLKERGYEFCFSLYKNDIIRYELKGKEFEERFLSVSSTELNRIEVYPINAKEYKPRRRPTLSKKSTTKIEKIVTDILGNKYLVKKEKFRKTLDN
ncbi:type II CRISPR RNA-guided endonuclease Cas9 [Lachnobacterium bovis]|uniref:CRISPR-associated endonuclease Cas9 n=1 Tax=Lachnobacterium bovis DSM 14045 TaxID=1122142 RepID=A0A1H3KV61_9FIRM|nr:type II CRISPR RNA-guided endonuclease Cas9 [Lachnobacterium bovis]SDY55859.1 CRISPR-associated endonuclease Csn1 [Lachnobacterium bovis DSM 14045]